MARIIFFPGLSADERMFDNQRSLPGKHYFVKWLDPAPFKDMYSYAEAHIEQIGFKKNDIFIGVSLGGLIAQIIAEKLEPKQLVAISTFTSKTELNILAQWLLPLAPILPTALFSPSLMPDFMVRLIFKAKTKKQIKLVKSMAAGYSNAFTKKQMSLIRSVDGRTQLKNKVRIHGRKDHVINHPLPPVDIIIEKGGHLCNITNSDEVNSFILSLIDFADDKKEKRKHKDKKKKK